MLRGLLLIKTNKQDKEDRPPCILKIIPSYDLVNNKLH